MTIRSAAMGIGALAPGPGCGIAVWSLPNFASLQVSANMLYAQRYSHNGVTLRPLLLASTGVGC